MFVLGVKSLLESVHLVTVLSSSSEVESLCGGFHLGTGGGNGCFELGRREGGGGVVGLDIGGEGEGGRSEVVDELGGTRGFMGGLGNDSVTHIICDLLLATAVGLGNSLTDRIGAALGVKDHVTVGVASCTTSYLSERTCVTKKTLLVGIHHRNQRNLGQVEALAKKVNPNENIENITAKLLENTDTVESLDLRVDVAITNTDTIEVFRQLLGHTFGESGDEDFFIFGRAGLDLLDEVINLIISSTDLDRRVDDAGGTDDLFDDKALGFSELVIGRSSRNVDRSTSKALELIEFQGAVVASSRKTKAVFNEVLLTSTVATVHSADLGKRNVGLVDYEEVILGKVIEQAERRSPGRAAVEITRVILDTGAITNLLDHLEVELGTLFKALGFRRFADGFEEFDLFAKVELDLADSLGRALLCGDEEVSGRDSYLVEFFESLAGGGVDAGDGFEFVVEKIEADSHFPECHHNVNRITGNAESRGDKLALGASVKDVDQRVEERLTRNNLAGLKLDDGSLEVLGVTDTVNAGDGCDNNNVAAPGHQARSSAKAHLVDLVVNLKVLFYIGIRRGEVSLGLVVIVIGDEVLDGVMRKEPFELGVQLSSEGLVMRQDEGGPLELRDDVGNGESLTRTSDAEKCGVLRAGFYGAGELSDSLGLVASGRI